jgi:hypothetical protein
MSHEIEFRIGERRVRFTPDGRVVVVDAIDALSEADCPTCVWEDLKRRHPTLAELCSSYRFGADEALCVVDSEAWNIIEQVLLDYTLEQMP